MKTREELIDMYQENRYNDIYQIVRKYGTLVSETENTLKRYLTIMYVGLTFDFVLDLGECTKLRIR